MLRVATWNVCGVNARIDLIKDWLEERQPDIVGLQEIKTTRTKFPFEAFKSMGYYVREYGEPQINGVAIAAKMPTRYKITRRGLPGKEKDGARLIVGEFENLIYANVYCPSAMKDNEQKLPIKIEWFKALRDFCDSKINDCPNFLIGGDFNICQTWRDSHWHRKHGNKAIENGWDLHTPEERQALRDLGLTDLFRYKNPNSTEFTFWYGPVKSSFENDIGSRLDLLLGTQSIANRTVNVVIDQEYRDPRVVNSPSDHAPVYVDLV